MSAESTSYEEACAVHLGTPVPTFRGIFLAFVLVAGCGGGETAAPDAIELECPTTGRYFELATGASWSYRVEDPGGVEDKTQTVGPLEDVGAAKAGVSAYRMTTTTLNGEVVSWQEDTGTGILRHREQDLAGTTTTDEIYEPFKTRIDESDDRIVEGATWTEDYTETVTTTDETGTTTATIPKSERWLVEAVDEVIRVPAGDFCTLRVKRTSTTEGAGAAKTYWFARGVGKVREEGASQVEELTAWSPAE